MGKKLTKQENPMEIFLSYSFIFFYLVGGRERGWKEKWDGKYFFLSIEKSLFKCLPKKKEESQSINKYVSIDQDWGL